MDHRDRAALMPERLKVRPNKMSATFEYEDLDGVFQEAVVPITWVVCPTCDGKGTHVNPSIDAHGLSYEDFGEDPDFAESYRAGHYDVPCYECGGSNVVAELDRKRVDPEVLKAYQEAVEADHDFAAEVEAERRFGC